MLTFLEWSEVNGASSLTEQLKQLGWYWSEKGFTYLPILEQPAVQGSSLIIQSMDQAISFDERVPPFIARMHAIFIQFCIAIYHAMQKNKMGVIVNHVTHKHPKEVAKLLQKAVANLQQSKLSHNLFLEKLQALLYSPERGCVSPAAEYIYAILGSVFKTHPLESMQKKALKKMMNLGYEPINICFHYIQFIHKIIAFLERIIDLDALSYLRQVSSGSLDWEFISRPSKADHHACNSILSIYQNLEKILLCFNTTCFIEVRQLYDVLDHYHQCWAGIAQHTYNAYQQIIFNQESQSTLLNLLYHYKDQLIQQIVLAYADEKGINSIYQPHLHHALLLYFHELKLHLLPKEERDRMKEDRLCRAWFHNTDYQKSSLERFIRQYTLQNIIGYLKTIIVNNILQTIHAQQEGTVSQFANRIKKISIGMSWEQLFDSIHSSGPPSRYYVRFLGCNEDYLELKPSKALCIAIAGYLIEKKILNAHIISIPSPMFSNLRISVSHTNDAVDTLYCSAIDCDLHSLFFAEIKNQKNETVRSYEDYYSCLTDLFSKQAISLQLLNHTIFKQLIQQWLIREKNLDQYPLLEPFIQACHHEILKREAIKQKEGEGIEWMMHALLLMMVYYYQQLLATTHQDKKVQYFHKLMSYLNRFDEHLPHTVWLLCYLFYVEKKITLQRAKHHDLHSLPLTLGLETIQRFIFFVLKNNPQIKLSDCDAGCHESSDRFIQLAYKVFSQKRSIQSMKLFDEQLFKGSAQALLMKLPEHYFNADWHVPHPLLYYTIPETLCTHYSQNQNISLWSLSRLLSYLVPNLLIGLFLLGCGATLLLGHLFLPTLAIFAVFLFFVTTAIIATTYEDGTNRLKCLSAHFLFLALSVVGISMLVIGGTFSAEILTIMVGGWCVMEGVLNALSTVAVSIPRFLDYQYIRLFKKEQEHHLTQTLNEIPMIDLRPTSIDELGVCESKKQPLLINKVNFFATAQQNTMISPSNVVSQTEKGRLSLSGSS